MIRGYLRLGGRFGDGAVVDYEFNTTDVCVVVDMTSVTDKYLNHYLRDTDLGDQRRSRNAKD
jgi:putative hemolysin